MIDGLLTLVVIIGAIAIVALILAACPWITLIGLMVFPYMFGNRKGPYY